MRRNRLGPRVVRGPQARPPVHLPCGARSPGPASRPRGSRSAIATAPSRTSPTTTPLSDHGQDRAAREFVDAYPAVEAGLLLVGPAGRGKTHLACAILSELVTTKGATGLYVDFSDLLMKIQTTFRPDADASKESVLTPYADAELLVLDELGASKPHAWVLDVLYSLLNTRYNRKRITIATSNFEDELDGARASASGSRTGSAIACAAACTRCACSCRCAGATSARTCSARESGRGFEARPAAPRGALPARPAGLVLRAREASPGRARRFAAACTTRAAAPASPPATATGALAEWRRRCPCRRPASRSRRSPLRRASCSGSG